MGYELTVRCDVRQGNRLEKTRCHSDAQAKKVPILHEAPTVREARYGLIRKAKLAGWRHVHWPGRSMQWICPVCPAPGKGE